MTRSARNVNSLRYFPDAGAGLSIQRSRLQALAIAARIELIDPPGARMDHEVPSPIRLLIVRVDSDVVATQRSSSCGERRSIARGPPAGGWYREAGGALTPSRQARRAPGGRPRPGTRRSGRRGRGWRESAC